MELRTDRRLLAAIMLVAEEHDLPRREGIRAMLAIKANHAALGRIGAYYQQQAWLVLRDHLNEAHTAAHSDSECVGHHYDQDAELWPLRLAEAVVRAADYAYQIRIVAQGPQGQAPDPRVWDALLGALTILVVRAWIGSTSPTELPVYVRALVDTIGGL